MEQRLKVRDVADRLGASLTNTYEQIADGRIPTPDLTPGRVMVWDETGQPSVPNSASKISVIVGSSKGGGGGGGDGDSGGRKCHPRRDPDCTR